MSNLVNVHRCRRKTWAVDADVPVPTILDSIPGTAALAGDCLDSLDPLASFDRNLAKVMMHLVNVYGSIVAPTHGYRVVGAL